MANHPSALKRYRQSVKRQARNVRVKSTVRHVVRTLREAVAAKDLPKAQAYLRNCSQLLDRSASKGVYHHRTVSRKIARLAKLVDQLRRAA